MSSVPLFGRVRGRPARRLMALPMLLAVVALLALLAGTVVVPAVTAGARVTDRLVNKYGSVPPLSRTLPRPPERSVIYAANGKVLADLYLDQDRTVVPLSAIPMVARNAVIAIEDSRFYSDHGIDFRGIERALVADIRSHHVVEGGSTLTQQLVKNLITGDALTFRRKLTEAIYAVELDKLLTKNEILEAYLNVAYFGDGVYGIATAAEHYFSIPVSKLDLAQAAALAGTIASPEVFKPDDPKFAMPRRNVVLARMAQLGYITPAVARATMRRPMDLKLSHHTVVFPYFVSYIKQVLLTSPAFDAALGPADSPQRLRSVFQGGLAIHTTLVPAYQRLAEAAENNVLHGTSLASALVSLDPRSGAVLAMVGGSNFARSQVNDAVVNAFQAGSTFKLFTLIAALEERIPDSFMLNTPSPVTVTAPECPPSHPWVVANAERSPGGRIPLSAAIAYSVNSYFAQLEVKVGIPKVLDVARALGMPVPRASAPAYHNWNICSFTLGTINTSPLQVASAFGTVADKGLHCSPFAISSVVGPDGRQIYAEDPSASCTRAIPEPIAAHATSLLEGVVRDPGATGILANIGRPLAGKTGTTENEANAWFTGYVPQLVTSVWVGHQDGYTPMLYDYHGSAVFGGTYPALIFSAYMRAALAHQPVLSFPTPPPPPPPPGVTLPNVVGQKLTPAGDALLAFGLQVQVQEIPSVLPAGTVVSMNPSPGSVVAQNTTVTLQVSNGTAPGAGPPPTTVQAPPAPPTTGAPPATRRTTTTPPTTTPPTTTTCHHRKHCH